jgi:transcriptional regulator with XRE-family HTH domain
VDCYVANLGEYLRTRREELRLTQEQLAAKIGVSQATVSQYEQGAITPRPRNLFSLADALQLPPDAVLAASGFFSARVPGERQPPLTEGPASDRDSDPASLARTEPVERAANALFARMREWVGPELWSEVLVALQRLISEVGTDPPRQAHAGMGNGKEQAARPQNGDEGNGAEIAETYESREELVKRLPGQLGVSSPFESGSGS